MLITVTICHVFSGFFTIFVAKGHPFVAKGDLLVAKGHPFVAKGDLLVAKGDLFGRNQPSAGREGKSDSK